jgi:hypothetical protein
MTILHGGSIIGCSDLPEKYRNGTPPPAQPVQATQEHYLDDVTRPEQLLLFSSTPAAATDEIWPESGIDFNALVNDFESQLIIQALKLTQGNKKEAARLLNLKRTTLLEKIKKKELFPSWEEEDEGEYERSSGFFYQVYLDFIPDVTRERRGDQNITGPVFYGLENHIPGPSWSSGH